MWSEKKFRISDLENRDRNEIGPTAKVEPRFATGNPLSRKRRLIRCQSSSKVVVVISSSSSTRSDSRIDVIPRHVSVVSRSRSLRGCAMHFARCILPRITAYVGKVSIKREAFNRRRSGKEMRLCVSTRERERTTILWS